MYSNLIYVIYKLILNVYCFLFNTKLCITYRKHYIGKIGPTMKISLKLLFCKRCKKANRRSRASQYNPSDSLLFVRHL